LGAFGSAEYCRARVAAYRSAGVDSVSITSLSRDARADFAQFAR
jgi:hypothetical protein